MNDLNKLNENTKIQIWKGRGYLFDFDLADNTCKCIRLGPDSMDADNIEYRKWVTKKGFFRKGCNMLFLQMDIEVLQESFQKIKDIKWVKGGFPTIFLHPS